MLPARAESEHKRAAVTGRDPIIHHMSQTRSSHWKQSETATTPALANQSTQLTIQDQNTPFSKNSAPFYRELQYSALGEWKSIHFRWWDSDAIWRFFGRFHLQPAGLLRK